MRSWNYYQISYLSVSLWHHKVHVSTDSNMMYSTRNNKMTCASSEVSEQPGPLLSLISVFAVRMKKPWVLSYPLSTQRGLWSDWADAQADLSLRCVHGSFCRFCRVHAHMMCSTKMNCMIHWTVSCILVFNLKSRMLLQNIPFLWWKLYNRQLF